MPDTVISLKRPTINIAADHEEVPEGFRLIHNHYPAGLLKWQYDAEDIRLLTPDEVGRLPYGFLCERHLNGHVFTFLKRHPRFIPEAFPVEKLSFRPPRIFFLATAFCLEEDWIEGSVPHWNHRLVYRMYWDRRFEGWAWELDFLGERAKRGEFGNVAGDVAAVLTEEAVEKYGRKTAA